MQENRNTDAESSNGNQKNNRASHKVVWFIVGAGVIGVLVILFVSIFWPNMAERTKFFTANALSVLLLDVIIIQAYIYRRQWEVMQDHAEQNRQTVKAANRSIDLAQDNMIYAQRAYVAMTKGEVHFAESRALFVMHIENAGHTPASEVEVMATVEIRSDPPPPDREITHHAYRIGIILPGRFIVSTNWIDRTTEDRKLMDAKRVGLYCQGRIRYRDIFGQARLTKFSVVHTPGGKNFAPCETGNEVE